MLIKIVFTLIFLSLAIVHLFFSNLDVNIDTISLFLILLAFVPWVGKYVKSFEINGLGKVELLDMYQQKKIGNKIKKISKPTSGENKYSKIDDPKLALAAIRIDIESNLNEIAMQNNIEIRNRGLRAIAEKLINDKLITNDEYSIILDMSNILNKAVHSQLDNYDIKSYNWVLENGNIIVKSLESKIAKNKK